MADAGIKFTPPYGVSWDTFIRAIDKMQADGLPLRVDRSYLSSQSGNVQTYLMQALRSFGLIDEAGAPTETLKELVSGEDRPALIGDMLRRDFEPVLSLGSTAATQGQLEELWTEKYSQTGETRRKAVRFFMSGCAYAGIALSKLWKAPRVSGSAPRKTRTVAKRVDGKSGEAGAKRVAADDDSYQVTLRGGGTVTVIVAESHFNLSKNKDDRQFVFGLVDAMTDYANARGQDVASSDGEAAGPGSDGEGGAP